VLQVVADAQPGRLVHGHGLDLGRVKKPTSSDSSLVASSPPTTRHAKQTNPIAARRQLGEHALQRELAEQVGGGEGVAVKAW
jgi:hypothetical protein